LPESIFVDALILLLVASDTAYNYWPAAKLDRSERLSRRIDDVPSKRSSAVGVKLYTQHNTVVISRYGPGSSYNNSVERVAAFVLT